MNEYKKESIYSFDQRAIVVQELKKLMQDFPVFAFVGPLGAGKTTIIRNLLRECGVRSNITSPTFMYVNEYENEQEQKFYHFDLYRITNLQEFQDQGFYEYLFQPNSWTFIEWPEVINPLLRHDVCFVFFDYHEEVDKRIVKIHCIQ